MKKTKNLRKGNKLAVGKSRGMSRDNNIVISRADNIATYSDNNIVTNKANGVPNQKVDVKKVKNTGKVKITRSKKSRRKKGAGQNIQPIDKSEGKMLFLIHLINTFTKKLNLESKPFYKKVNKLLQRNSSAKFTNIGMVNYQQMVNNYNKASTAGIFVSAKYLSHLGRVLSLIYQYGEKEIGEKNVLIKLQASFKLTRVKYKSEPSLEGYVPSTSLFASSTSYPQLLIRQMLKFVVNDVIKQGVKLDHSITAGSLTKLSSTKIIEQKIATVYNDILGPLGDKEFTKIKDDFTLQHILTQINTWKKEGILSEKQGDKFEEKIKVIYGVPVSKATSKLVVDFFGVEREVKNAV